MTGPDVLRPIAGDNAIGEFAIGMSPIGSFPNFDPWSTIISQYANSPILTTMITNFFSYINQTKNLDAFFDKIRNLDTAVGYGLDVWGRIVGINRVLAIPDGDRYFGFDEAYPDFDPFNQSPFFKGDPLTSNYPLSDDGFRVLILAKAFSNICDGSIGSINRLLVMLFGSGGGCYVQDNLDMTFTYVFNFTPTPLQLAILSQSGVMPRPTGVKAIVLVS